ncbi:MAG: ATP-dependent RecD-like DNA helicase [Bacilli bacterium]|nr:ATP-dependent RecD-like DNA helicase [Bacillota bacterium]MBQ6282446.1 ATP-dependent RecD-like DNA helicase [Bacilli bacterium]
MNSYIRGNIREVFYKTDKGFMVGIFKIRETNDKELEEYVNRTITFSGNFHELVNDSEYKFYGETTNHPKYGFQFKVNYYEKLIPEEKDSIITFLSSGIFPGVGVKTATKIVEKLGDNTLDLILEDYNNLLMIPSIKEEKAKMIYDILYNEQLSYKTVLYLEEKGFSVSDSVKIYEIYKEKTIEVIENNIYDVISKVSGIGFLTIDRIALKLGIEKDDERRILSCILYAMYDLCLTTGNTYASFNEIYLKTYKYLDINIDISTFEYYILKLNKSNDVIILDDKYILKNIYDVETSISNKISILTKYPPKEIKGLDGVLDMLESVFEIKYNELQRKAIKSSLENRINIITGGPGTGKTTIIKGIVEAYKQIEKITDDKLINDMVLLAPTGRAARRIMEATNFSAFTIHKFLKWDKETDTFQINKFNKSDAKIVIIDESSMVDIFLFNSLLEGLNDDVRIILVGDYNQLPSVLPGQILKDLIDSDVVPTIKLNLLYRQKEDSYIINLSKEVNDGYLSDDFVSKKGDYNFIEVPKDGINSITCELCKKALEKGYNYNQIQVLIPMYRGVNGIDNLNNKLQEIFNPKDENKDEFIHNDITFREGDKVLQTKNINDLEISNGDIGIIDSITKTVNNVSAIINFDGVVVEFNKKNFDDLRLGYAISIHKSQGSEFDLVIMPMDMSFRRMLYRKLLYTGITRAKKSLTLVGEKEAFIYGVSRIEEESRHTLLCNFLKDSINF